MAAEPGLKHLAHVAVHFSGFKNVDLFSQGFYHIKVSVRDTGRNTRAQPCGAHDATLPPEAKLPSCILAETLQVASPTLRVQYIEQEIQFSSILSFRISLDPTQEEESSLAVQPLEIELRLMHAKSSTEFNINASLDEYVSKFNEVAVHKLQLHLPLFGGSAFFPLTFDEMHFCYAPLLVHAAILDFQPTVMDRQVESVQGDGSSSLLSRFVSLAHPHPCQAGKGFEVEGMEEDNKEEDVVVVVEEEEEDDEFSKGELDFISRQLEVRLRHLVRMHVLLTHRMRTLQKGKPPCVVADGLPLPPPPAAELPCQMPEAAQIKGVLPSSPASCQCDTVERAVGRANALASALTIDWDMFAPKELLHAAAQKYHVTRSKARESLAAIQLVSGQLWNHWRLFLQVAHCFSVECVREQSRAFGIRKSRLVNSFCRRQVLSFEHRAREHPTRFLSDQASEEEPLLPLEDASTAASNMSQFAEQIYHKPLQSEPPQCEPNYLLSWMDDKMTVHHHESLIHLYVLVHGFQGNAYDLRNVRNQLALMLPNKRAVHFLCSSWNEAETGQASFETLGANLAQEVCAFISTNIRHHNGDRLIRRVSFLCHSFGAIIARVALRQPQMQNLLPKLHAFVSFSSPHLGTLFSSNMLVELGMWTLRRINGATCLKQLALKDTRHPTDAYLFKLSQGDLLSLFSHIILVSSEDDRYVPHHSARIKLCNEALHDRGRYGAAYIQMLHNLLTPLNCTSLVHVDVAFPKRQASSLAHHLDGALGRKAHIDFIDDAAFIQMFVHRFLGMLA